MYIELKDINKSFGDYKASDHVSFGIEKGKLVALLGPSGSGKTTILRMIAGLEHQDDGDIFIDGQLVNDLPVASRGIGFVFQSYALFPYMTVYNNVAYGLKTRKVPKDQIRERVLELLDLVGLKGLENRYPEQLSGGQRQRVAFARALAPQPSLLLLDEPFAAIDAKVRQELRTWLRNLISRIGITSIFVTHDQDEAVEVADEIIVTNLGRVEQAGTPEQIYGTPRTPFVAKFIGESTVITGYDRLSGFEIFNGKTEAIVRPEFVRVQPACGHHVIERGIVKDRMFRGSSIELTVEVKGIELKTRQSPDETALSIGDEVEVLVYRLYVINGNEIHTLINARLAADNVYYI